MANVLITSEYFGKFSPEAKELLLKAGHNVIDNPYGHTLLNPEMIIPHAAEAEAMICDLEKITKEVMDAAPNLKIIARRGVGVDSVDCDYAEKKGIEVAKTLGVVEAPTAELAFSLMLNFARRVDVMSGDMHCGHWTRHLGSNLQRKVLGIAGMGRIGYEVARRAAAFDMKILYFDLCDNEKADALGAKRVSLDELLERSDYLSVHLTSTPETKGLFNYDSFNKMKKDACFINAARGAIVDVDGLKRALEEGCIAGAAIDVFDREPEENSPLRGLDNVLLTPHVATFTRETFIDMDVEAARNVIRYFERG